MSADVFAGTFCIPGCCTIYWLDNDCCIGDFIL